MKEQTIAKAYANALTKSSAKAYAITNWRKNAGSKVSNGIHIFGDINSQPSLVFSIISPKVVFWYQQGAGDLSLVVEHNVKMACPEKSTMSVEDVNKILDRFKQTAGFAMLFCLACNVYIPEMCVSYIM